MLRTRLTAAIYVIMFSKVLRSNVQKVVLKIYKNLVVLKHDHCQIAIYNSINILRYETAAATEIVNRFC